MFGSILGLCLSMILNICVSSARKKINTYVSTLVTGSTPPIRARAVSPLISMFFFLEYICICKSVSGQPTSPIYIIVGVFICFVVERVRSLGFGDEVVLNFLLP